MIVEVWRTGPPFHFPVKDVRCCGLLWQVVKGGLQGRYWNAAIRCPRCGKTAGKPTIQQANIRLQSPPPRV